MRIKSLMPYAFGVMMFGALMAACCVAAAQPQDLSSKIADRADLANMDLTHMNLSGVHINQSNLS